MKRTERIQDVWRRLARLDDRFVVRMESLRIHGKAALIWRITILPFIASAEPSVVVEGSSALDAVVEAMAAAEARGWIRPERAPPIGPNRLNAASRA